MILKLAHKQYGHYMGQYGIKNYPLCDSGIPQSDIHNIYITNFNLCPQYKIYIQHFFITSSLLTSAYEKKNYF